MPHLFYSAARNAFLDPRLHPDLPEDAVPITAGDHARLLAAQGEGKIIRPGDDGQPTARRPSRSGEALRARLIVATRREAARRIEAVAPLWRQLNDWRELPSAQGAQRAAIEQRAAAIDALRAASNRLEQRLAGMTARQLAKADIAADHHWTQGDAA